MTFTMNCNNYNKLWLQLTTRMAERSSWLRFSGEEVLAFLEEEEVKYEEMDDNIYAPSSDVDLGVDSDMEETGVDAVEAEEHNAEDR